MTRPYVSPYDTSRARGYLIVVCAVSAAVECVRYVLYTEQYRHEWWWVPAGLSLFGNYAYHCWNLPDTLVKTTVSAALSAMPMPAVLHTFRELTIAIAAAVWQFIAANVTGLFPLP